MNVHALNIPEDPSHLHGWLERHLVDVNLSALAAELEVVHRDGPAAPSTLEEVLDTRRDEVLTSGLAALRKESVVRLLVQPRLLLELQAEILVSGGSYWDQVAGEADDQLQSAVQRGHNRFNEYLESQQRPYSEGSSVTVAGPVAWTRHPAIVSVTTAACVLLGVFLYQHYVPRTAVEVVAGWGWSNPDALPRDVSPEEYLRQVADAAAAWFKKRPDDRAGLAKRIGQFRQGCSVVMLTDHQPLAVEDRQWLVDKCRLWAGKLDQLRADVERADSDLDSVRDATDTTINQLIAALNGRADEIARG